MSDRNANVPPSGGEPGVPGRERDRPWVVFLTSHWLSWIVLVLGLTAIRAVLRHVVPRHAAPVRRTPGFEPRQRGVGRVPPAPGHGRSVPGHSEVARVVGPHRGTEGTLTATVGTLEVRHDAHDPEVLAACPPADVSADRIGELLACDLPTTVAGRRPIPTATEVSQ